MHSYVIVTYIPLSTQDVDRMTTNLVAVTVMFYTTESYKLCCKYLLAKAHELTLLASYCHYFKYSSIYLHYQKVEVFII